MLTGLLLQDFFQLQHMVVELQWTVQPGVQYAAKVTCGQTEPWMEPPVQNQWWKVTISLPNHDVILLLHYISEASIVLFALFNSLIYPTDWDDQYKK